jgi:hypothetical protein
MALLASFLVGCGLFGCHDTSVSDQRIETGIAVQAGSKVHLVADGTVDFGGAVAGFGAPKLDANGDGEIAPLDYPAPGLAKNSLIAKVGSIWYQGGTDATFVPTEQGQLILQPNDWNLGDNSRGWCVAATVTPPKDPGAFPLGGPYPVSNHLVSTGMPIVAGSTVLVQSEGTVDFGGGFLGGGAPKLDAEGDSEVAPSDYPAPGLRKNSLIAKVGSLWYQGGIDRTFVPTQDGELILQPNDAKLEDNSRGWHVWVFVTPPPNPGGPFPAGGPYQVSNKVIHTGLLIAPGSTVSTLTEGQVDFGGAVIGIGAPTLDADGDKEPAPSDYPAPGLRKNSLIAKVGSLPYQGGTIATFTPTQDGELILQPNDNQLEDNSRGWHVSIYVSPPAPSTPIVYGPFGVVNREVSTGIHVATGDEVLTQSTGEIDFGGGFLGGGAPVLDADGDNYPTPPDYPAPRMLKNSLIVRVAATPYQGGVNVTFVSNEEGELTLLPNDKELGDNSRGWLVTITVTPSGSG